MTPEAEKLIAQGKAVDVQLKTLLWEIELLASQRRVIFRKLNKEHGLSIRAIGAAFGIHHTRISQTVNGRKPPKGTLGDSNGS